MPLFSYQAINNRGNSIRDRIEAADAASAVEQIRRGGLTVTELTEEDTASGNSGDLLTQLTPLRAKDIALFFRMFAALVKSNIPISEGVAILHGQSENRKLKKVLDDIRVRIEGGMPLSEAMEPHARVFGEMVVKMIRAGELGGMLDLILERIADFLEERSALRSRMITSMIYPAVVVLATMGVVIFLVTYVIPKFAILLGGRKLPANTQFLIDLATIFKKHGSMLAIGFVAVVAGIFLLMMLPEVRLWFDRHKVKIPIIGSIIRYGVVVQFASTLSALLQSGITLVDALKATTDTLTNQSVKAGMEEVTERVTAGTPLSEAMADDRFFPPMVKALVSVGEYSGLMDESWQGVGEICGKILKDKIARMTAMIEPVLIMTLGSVVGYVAWGLIAGMLTMYAAAGK
jgi:type IV pilus assembly protein PilC